jgi:hypothetical protein
VQEKSAIVEAIAVDLLDKEFLDRVKFLLLAARGDAFRVPVRHRMPPLGKFSVHEVILV